MIIPFWNRPGSLRVLMLFATLCLFLPLTACTRTNPPPPAPGPPTADITAVIPAAKRAELYPFDPASSLNSRVGPIPPQLLQYLRDLDETDAYQDYELSAEERALVRENLFRLPKWFSIPLEKRLTGIYFIRNFQGSGWTDFLISNDHQLSVYMVFNPETLHQNVSELLTKKENSAFIPDPAGKIRISIDCGTRHPGFTYILFHESAHAADYVAHVTPYPEPVLLKVPGYQSTGSYGGVTEPFWAGYDLPAPAINWPYRGRVHFYGFGDGPKLRADEAVAVYRALQATPFVSLYATKNWAEDFADLFAFFSLTGQLGCPYRINVEHGATRFSYEPLAQPLVKQRYQIVQVMWSTLP